MQHYRSAGMTFFRVNFSNSIVVGLSASPSTREMSFTIPILGANQVVVTKTFPSGSIVALDSTLTVFNLPIGTWISSGEDTLSTMIDCFQNFDFIRNQRQAGKVL